MGRASGGFGARRSRPWLAHGAVPYANDAPKRFPDAPVPHQQLRKRPCNGCVAEKYYKTYCFFILFVIAFSTKLGPLGVLGRAFWGPKAIFGGSLGSLGAPPWPKVGPMRVGDAPKPPQDGPKTPQDCPKTAPRRTRRGTPPHPSHQTSPCGPTVAKIRSKFVKFWLKFG